MVDQDFEDVRLADLRTFIVVQRVLSVAAAARELRVTPSQVSKAVVRLEKRLGQKLLARSSTGVALTVSARRLVPEIEALLTRFESLRRRQAADTIELTLAAEPYLVSICFPILVAAAPSGVRLAGVEVSETVVRARMAENVFDLTIVGADSLRLPATWARDRIGIMRKGLFATPARAKTLGGSPVLPSALHDVPFVTPVSNHAGDPFPADDGCPLDLRARLLGHQAESMSVALECAVCADQITFGPVAAARRYVDAGLLVEVNVRGWDVREELFLTYSAERIPKRLRDTFLARLRAVFDDTTPATPATPRGARARATRPS